LSPVTQTTFPQNFYVEHTVKIGPGFGDDAAKFVAFGFLASHIELRLKTGTGPVFVSWSGKDGVSEIQLEIGEVRAITSHGRSFVYLRSVLGGEVVQIRAERNALEHSV